MSEAQVSCISNEFLLTNLAEHFCKDGGPAALREIAWWGSALVDIAGTAATGQAPDEGLLREAALFNLGVALFDTVVDEYPAKVHVLALSLHPERLRLRLAHPRDQGSLRCHDPVVAPIARLADASLGSMARRLADDASWRDELTRMLEAMYESELRISGDPFDAKSLPLKYLGNLAIPPGHRQGRAFFEKLSRFLAYWDDFVDLQPDLLSRAPNRFLTPHSPRGWRQTVRHTARGIVRIAGGGMFNRDMVSDLDGALGDALDAAQQVNPAAYHKTAALCRYMFG